MCDSIRASKDARLRFNGDRQADLGGDRRADAGVDAGHLDRDRQRVVLAAIALGLVLPPAAHRVDCNDAALGEVGGIARENVRVERASVAGVLAEVPLRLVAAGGGLGLSLLERLLVEALVELGRRSSCQSYGAPAASPEREEHRAHDALGQRPHSGQRNWSSGRSAQG